MPDERCPYCEAPIQVREDIETGEELRLEVHASPVPRPEAWIILAGRAEVRRAGPGSAHVYTEHVCCEPQETRP